MQNLYELSNFWLGKWDKCIMNSILQLSLPLAMANPHPHLPVSYSRWGWIWSHPNWWLCSGLNRMLFNSSGKMSSYSVSRGWISAFCSSKHYWLACSLSLHLAPGNSRHHQLLGVKTYPARSAWNLGAIFDKNFTFCSHISAVCSSCFLPYAGSEA